MPAVFEQIAILEADYLIMRQVRELKYHGFRCLTIRDSGRVRLLSRRGGNMSACFPESVLDFRAVPGDVVLDGEPVALDKRGVPQFERLSRRALLPRSIAITDAAKRDPAALLAFDARQRG